MGYSSQTNPRGAQAINVSVAVGIIATTAVCLRILARSKSKAPLALDDWIIVGSLLPLFAMISASVLMVTQGGLGRPARTLQPSEMSILLKTLMATMLTYSTTVTTVRVSILLLYRRLFITRSFKLATLFVASLCMLWLFTASVMDVFQCHPFSAAFNARLLFTDECINLQAFYWGVTSTNMILDIVVLCLPVPMVWALKISKRQKITLSGIFLLGGFVCLAAMMRIVSIGRLEEIDIAYSLIPEYVWSQIEPAIAILCACIVTYRPLFTPSVLPTLISKSLGSFSRGNGTSSTESESTMAWPIARDVLGRDVEPDHELYSRAGRGALHVVNVGHCTQNIAEQQAKLDGEKSPGISVRRSIEIAMV